MDNHWEIAPSTIRLDVGEADLASDIVSAWMDEHHSDAHLYHFDPANDRCEVTAVDGDLSKHDVLERVTGWLDAQAAVRKYLVNVNEWSDRVEVRNRVSDHVWAAQTDSYVAVQQGVDEYVVMGRKRQQIAELHRLHGEWHGTDLITTTGGAAVRVGPFSSPVDAFEAILVAGGWVTPGT
jgi:hypothetical protein